MLGEDNIEQGGTNSQSLISTDHKQHVEENEHQMTDQIKDAEYVEKADGNIKNIICIHVQ